MRDVLDRLLTSVDSNLAFTLKWEVAGISVDWEYSYGNNQTCFVELWSFVHGVIAPHGKGFAPWVSNGGGWNGGPGNADAEWDYMSYLPWADRLINMGSYETTGDAFPGKNRSVAPVPCAGLPGRSNSPAGRWCGLEGTITDMLAHNATPQQIVPGIWMDPCRPDGLQTMSGWTQLVLREFLDFAASKQVDTIAIWTDGAMEVTRPYPMGNPGLSTCDFFVPELRRWALHGSQ